MGNAARPSEATFPQREELLGGVKGVLAQYAGTPVTVRQLYYRLVAAHLIPNTQRSYKNVVAALTAWRRGREVPLEAFEDRTRSMDRFDKGWRTDDPKGWLKAWLTKAVEESRNYHLARWLGQDFRVVVAVEKQALEGPFSEVCRELAVDLAVCRGYPSLSFLNEVGKALRSDDRDRDGRSNVVLYFGDFDPSGLNIPETVERDLREFFRRDFEFVRVALTREQIDERELPPAPVKMGDSRSNGFIAEHGEEVYELDAIEPRELQDLIRSAVTEYWDEEADADRDAVVDAGRDLIEKTLEEAGVPALIAKLDGGS